MVAQQPDVTGFFSTRICFVLFFLIIICLTKRQNSKYVHNMLHDGIKENNFEKNQTNKRNP